MFDITMFSECVENIKQLKAYYNFLLDINFTSDFYDELTAEQQTQYDLLYRELNKLEDLYRACARACDEQI